MTLIVLDFTRRTVTQSFGGVKPLNGTFWNSLTSIEHLLKNINIVYATDQQLNNNGLILVELKINKRDVQTNDSARNQ